MIKMAIVTGVVIAAGYWFVMSATMNLAMGQAENYERQYRQAVMLAEQVAAGDPANR
ncbi:MAG TPA: hypothetical protein VGE30_01855 [Candidatus Saccharimonadales bacterium]